MAQMRKPPTTPSRLFRTAFRRGGALLRDTSAAVAVEFAVLALPFFTIVAAILETAVVFLAGQILESAVQDSSRLIRTGQAQAANYTSGDYRRAICDGLYGLFDCNSSRLRVRVDVLPRFQAASSVIGSPVGPNCATDPNDCNWSVQESFNPGLGNNIIVVQAYYKWPTIVDLPWFNLANQAGGDRLLAAIRIFRNEPFS